MSHNFSIYLLRCLTNLHVGSGEGNLGIIDKEVERDPITHYPMIYSSGLKGAIRAIYPDDFKEEIFGHSKGSKELKAGTIKFLDAHLLAIPMRASAGNQSSYLVTTKTMLANYLRFCSIAGEVVDNLEQVRQDLESLTDTQSYKFSSEREIGVEGIVVNNHLNDKPNLTDFLSQLLQRELAGSQSLIILSENHFRQYQLPVRARNKIKKFKGDNNNLWYEEHVPYGSVFYTGFIYNGEQGSKDAADYLELFEEGINNLPYIQIGANETIGFGMVKFTKKEF
ncbi:TPA: type III-B CRISPR module RAMP protein Cmr4 [Streptococcus suis]